MDTEEFSIYHEGKEIARASIYLRDPHWGTLEEVVVTGNKRGEGFGRAVCEKALTWAKTKNINLLVTACPIFHDSLDEHQLKDFYESLGFELLTSAPGRYYLELINDPSHSRPLLHKDLANV